MSTKELQLVTFIQARRLKKLGFNWGCEYAYRWSPQALIKLGVCAETINAINGYASAPSVALALKWFRDEKNIKYEISIDCGGYKGSIADDSCHFLIRKTEIHKSYESAESALLDELLTILEKEK